MHLLKYLIWLIIIPASCGEKIYTGDVDCSECYWPEPDSADIVVSVTISEEFPEVPLVIYRGDIEDNQIDYVDTARSSPYYLFVRLNSEYSVKAEYKRDHATLYVIDGTKIRTMLVSEACDGECYVIENASMNAEIKNDFLDF